MSVSLEVKGGNPTTKDVFTAQMAEAVTPSDTTVVKYRALYVGTTGDVAVVPMGGSSAVTFVGVPAGAILPIAVSKVMSTSTTASDIVGLI